MIQTLQQKLVSIIFIAVIIGLSLRLFAGDGSLVHIYLLNKEILVIEKSLHQGKMRNEQLMRVTQSLKNDNDMIETIARRDMQMIHKDEVFFVLQ